MKASAIALALLAASLPGLGAESGPAQSRPAAGKAFAYVTKGADGRYLGEANKTTGLDPAVRAAVRREGDTTVYEILFPRAALPGVKLQRDGSFGFSLLVNDNDGGGRKTGLTLAPKGSEPYAHPEEYRDLVLTR